MGSLMDKPIFVSLSQWIGRTKKFVRQNVVLVGVCDGCAEEPRISARAIRFIKIRTELIDIFRGGNIGRRQVYLFASFYLLAILTLALIEFGTEMRSVLPFLAQSIRIQLGEGHLRTHKND